MVEDKLGNFWIGTSNGIAYFNPYSQKSISFSEKDSLYVALGANTGYYITTGSYNTFLGNKVKLVARLWGAKNNTYSNNKIQNSGELVVEENLPLKMMY